MFNIKWAQMDTVTLLALDSYIETALWSSADQTEDGEEIMMEDYEVSEDFKEKARVDISNFINEIREAELLGDLDIEQVAHDFWLTRNGHGTGFWDGDYEKELGKELTKRAEAYGSCNLYLGDDGLVYCS